MLNALWVVLGAGLWATDTIFRHPMTSKITPVTVVWFEHVFATLLSLISLILLKQNPFLIRGSQWGSLFWIGTLGSALATILFTASFQYLNPTVAILIQKIQPVLVITGSALLLGERPKGKFWFWATVAWVSAFFVSFPQGIDWNPPQGETYSQEWRGIGFALSAAVLWSSSTLIGKRILDQIPSHTVTFWRFVFGLGATSVLVFLSIPVRFEIPFVWADVSVLRSLFYMAALSGFLGVGVYYRGLARVPAAVATLLELTFPLAAIVINSYFLDFQLSVSQLIGALALMVAMVGVGRSQDLVSTRR